MGFIIVAIIVALLYFFFDTQLGQAYIATGDNETMAKSLGIHTDAMKILGLVLSNGVIALSGALIAQHDGYADVSKGVGVIVIGLASIIIGEVLYGNLTLFERLIAIVIGSIIYQLLILFVIKVGFPQHTSRFLIHDISDLSINSTIEKSAELKDRFRGDE